MAIIEKSLEEVMDHELVKRIVLDKLANDIKKRREEALWWIFSPVLYLNDNYNELEITLIKKEKEFFSNQVTQFIAEILGIRVLTNFIKPRFPNMCYRYGFRIQIEKHK